MAMSFMDIRIGRALRSDSNGNTALDIAQRMRKRTAHDG